MQAVERVFAALQWIEHGPVPEAVRQYVERGAAVRVPVGVAQPGKRLVQRVPQRPEAVQIEVGRTDIAPRHVGKRLAHALQRAGEAITVLVLAATQAEAAADSRRNSDRVIFIERSDI